MTRHVLTIIALLSGLWPLGAAAGWPEIPFPDGSRAESIGQDVRLNGVPMRMTQVQMKQSVNQVVLFYREHLGPRLAETTLPGGVRILAQGRDDYFITLRIRPTVDKASVALISISDVRAAKEAANRSLGFTLPADSRVLSDMESTDGGKRSRHLVFQNRLDMETNRQALARELLGRGYRVDSVPSRTKQDAQVVYFQGDKREAQLTLIRHDGRTQGVLTTIQAP